MKAKGLLRLGAFLGNVLEREPEGREIREIGDARSSHLLLVCCFVTLLSVLSAPPTFKPLKY